MTWNNTLLVLTCSLLLLSAGCNGSGGQGMSLDTPGTVTGAGALLESTGQAGMPGLGSIEEPVNGPKIAASKNNYLLGREAIATSPEGTSVGIDNLIMTSSDGTNSWGVWRWGRFADGVVPEELVIWSTVDSEHDYWLLLSNYAEETWEVIGPLTDGAFSFIYNEPYDYISENGYTYAVLLVVNGNELDVQHLNILAEKDITPPASPLDLTYDYVGPTSVQLLWQQDYSSGLRRYNIYQGPVPSFDLDGPGVEMIAQPESFMDKWPVGNLTPETEYAFCITLTDMAGNESLPSNFVNLTTLVMPDYFPPEGLTVIDVGSSWVDLAWLAPEPEPLGYNAYTGPDEIFFIEDPEVVQRNHGLIESTIWRMTDLECETEYHAAVQAYYDTGTSVLSDSVTFTTTASTPPEPDFIYDPTTIYSGDQVAFDPGPTTDGDTPSSELIFKWDFDGDGIIDTTTNGPEEVNWHYQDRGTYPVNLTVSDGTSVSVSEDLDVEIKYDYVLGPAGTGYPATVVALDTSPGQDPIVALLESNGAYQLLYYADDDWNNLDISSIAADYYCDVSLSPTGPVLLVADFDGSQVDWGCYDYDNGFWDLNQSGSQPAESFVNAGLEISASDRYSVGLIAAQDVAGSPEYHIYAWHEKADGTFSANDTLVGGEVFDVFDIQRSDTDTKLLYCRDLNLRLWQISDTATSDTAVQSYTGDPLFISSGIPYQENSRLFWALATDSSRIYWGDDYGVAVQSSMFWTTDFTPTGLLGVGYVGDNASYFVWTETRPDDVQRLLSCAPFPDGGGTATELAAGVGVAAGGLGSYYLVDSTQGIATIADEARDGECVYRFTADNTVESSEVVFVPSGTTNVGVYHQGLVLTDGSILTLAAQQFASARRSLSAYPGATFLHSENGSNNWLVPHTSCPTRYAGEYFVGSFTENGALEVTLQRSSSNSGQSKLNLVDAGLADLAYNPFSTDTALCYTMNGGRDLMFRRWGGIAWTDPTPVFTGAHPIEAIQLKGNNQFNWGVVYIDADGVTRLSESDINGFHPAEVISTEPVDSAAGVGLDYNTDMRRCVTMLWTDTDPGVYVGIAAAGEEFSWERVAEPGGTGADSLNTFFHLDSPVVVYYQGEANLTDGRVHFVEYLNGAWINTELPGQLHASPVDANRDVFGNIILAGYRVDGAVMQAVSGLIYR